MIHRLEPAGDHFKETRGPHCYSIPHGGMALWGGIPKLPRKGITRNDLIQWTAIQRVCYAGFRFYGVMDVGDNPRVKQKKVSINP